jgi:hypothetical protein
MRNWIFTAMAAAFLCAPVLAQEGGGDEDPIEALKKILGKMEAVEKLLTKARLEEGAAGQAEIQKELEELIKAGKVKQEEVADDLARQLKSVVDRMKDIDLDIDKIIQSVKMSQSQGSSSSGMEIKKPDGSKEEQEKKSKREAEEKKLLENQGEEKKGEEGKDPKDGGKKDSKEGKDGGKPGSDPAKRPYNAKGGEPPGGSRRATGDGRWGCLPQKEFQEAMAQGKMQVPEKYRALVGKFWEMLSKKAEEEERK